MNDPARSIAAIYERYHQSLYRFCFSIVGNAEDAQDALQNAMLKAVRALPGEQREIQLKPWLYRIAHNESIEILRKRREEAPIDPELVASSAGPDEEAATRERLQRLLADLSELPERQRGALVMRELAGLGFGEIGEALGTSEAVARQTVYEARLGLQQLEAGREMSCESVMRQISDADGRTMRRRDIRAHLRACPECRQFRDAIDGRSRDLAAIAPLPVAASAGILHALLGGAAGHTVTGAGAGAGAGTAGTIGTGAGKVVATSAVLKSAATVAAVAALGVGAADRSGVVDVGLPGGRASGVTSGETTSSGGSDAAAGDASAAATTAGSAVAAGRAGKQGVSGVAPAGPKGASDGDGDGATGPGGPRGAGEHGQPLTGEPAASQHGQETAAAHKATPDSSLTTGRGHSAAAKHHSGRRGHGHSRSRGARHPHRSHGTNAHPHNNAGQSHGGSGSQGSAEHQPQPSPPVESPEAQSPTTTTPEARAGSESIETSP
jgi:RNA polymerase sigma factor (sigma-70 family)